MSCCLGSFATALAQFYDFNNGTNTGWTQVDLGALGAPFSAATYSFPSDGLGGKAYQIFAPVPPVDAGQGPARAYSYPTPSYGRFSIKVDVIDWDPTVNQAFGLLARATSIALGTADGYVMNYNATDGDLQINLVSGENPTTIAETHLPMMPSGGPYRWVFTAYGDNLQGQVFTLPDTVNPLGSVVAIDSTNPNGQAGVFIFNRAANVTDANAYADATFDNYDGTVPANGALGATVVTLSPRPREQVTTLSPLVQVAILDRETTVDISSIQLSVDGLGIPAANLTLTNEVDMPNSPTPFPGATITYQPASFARLIGAHTNRVVFADNNGTRQTNEWTFILPVLRASNSAPPGSGTNSGFTLRLVQADGTVPLPNSIAVADAQLAVPPGIPSIFSTNTTADVISFTKDPTIDPPSVFPNTNAFPGIDPASADYLAMEVVAYLDLPAGTNRLGVSSDDGFTLTSGSSLTDTNGVVLGQSPFGSFTGTFDFFAEAAGVYPVRLVWYQTTGGAHVQLYSANSATAAPIALVNDTNNPVSIKAFRALAVAAVVLQSTSSLTPSNFQPDLGAIVDANTRTITVARSGAQRFYRLSSANALTITSVSLSVNNIVLRYQ